MRQVFARSSPMLVERRGGSSKESLTVAAAQASIRMRALTKRRGYSIRGYPLWTDQEDLLLRTMYPNIKAIEKRLRRRTENAIRKRLSELGLRRFPPHLWTAPEVSRLRRLWPAADKGTIVQAFPGIKWARLADAAGRRKICRRKTPLKITGNSLLDEVRARCRYLNYTLSDLDLQAGTGSYFRGRGWRRGHQIAKVAKAIKALGGKISVHWGD
jgi:hypothetical protein